MRSNGRIATQLLVGVCIAALGGCRCGEGVSFIFSLQVFMSGGGGAGVARRGGCKAGEDLFRELPGE